MYIGVSLFLLAVGAILRYAVNDGIQGIDLSVAGLILIIVGILGLVISLIFAILPNDRGRGGRAY